MPEMLPQHLYLLIEPILYVTEPGKRIYWLYLLSSALMAFALLYWKGGLPREMIKKSLSPLIWFSASSRVDMQWTVANHVLRVLLVVPLIGGQIALAMWVNKILYGLFGEGDYLGWGLIPTSVVFTVCLFLLEDFSRFYVHYLYHRVPLLWRFHAIHHSATQLTPLTLYRIHSVEMMINSCRSLLVAGGLSGVFIYLFRGTVDIVDVMGISVFSFLFNLAGSNLRHSGVWLGFGALEKWFISPAQHQIHHSTAAAHIDKNYGAGLAIWDRWFGSWVASRGEQVPAFGLAGKSVKQRLSSQLGGL